MYPLGLHFQRMLVSLQPDPERVKLAIALPGQVRDFLKETEDFATAYPHTRLVGSYAQDLSVGDIKDVDILVVTIGDPEENDPSAATVVPALANALKGFPEYTGRSGDASFDVDRNRRSVTVTFKDEDFQLDVVPCIAPDGLNYPIFVPDKGYDHWVLSHPYGVVLRIQELEKEYPGKARNLLKLLKYFRNYQMKYMRPKSYWLLAMGIDAIESGKIDTTKTLAECFSQLLEYLYTKFYPTYARAGATPHIKDPMLGHDVSPNWKRSDFETFMRRLDDGRGWALRAVETDEKDTAIEVWQKVFGEAFPTEVEEEARAMAAAFLPGAAAATGSGLIVPKDTPKSTPIPATRFYGER